MFLQKSAVRSRLAGPLVSRTIAMPVMFLHSHTPHTQTGPIDFNNPDSHLLGKKKEISLSPRFSMIFAISDSYFSHAQ